MEIVVTEISGDKIEVLFKELAVKRSVDKTRFFTPVKEGDHVRVRVMGGNTYFVPNINAEPDTRYQVHIGGTHEAYGGES